jgi:hypothetical protein
MLERIGRTLILATAAIGWMATAPLAAQTRLESIEPFLMERQAEIALARSAAPHGIGQGASVLVLATEGYEVAVRGSNGFACFVGRGWSGPLFVVQNGETVVHPDVFSPALHAPHCFNEEAARSVLPMHVMRTRALIAGRSVQEMVQVTAASLQSGELEAPPPGAFAYMMSSGQRLGRAGAFKPHVMLYLPGATNVGWGAPGFTPEYPSVVDGGTVWSVVVITTPMFADGTVPDGPTGSEEGGR